MSENDENGEATAQPRSLRTEDDQDQPEDATYEGGDQDRSDPHDDGA